MWQVPKSTLKLAARCAEVLRFMYPHGKEEFPPYASLVIRSWSLERYIAEVIREGVLAKEDALVAIYLLYTTDIKSELESHRPTYLPMVMFCALKVAVALRHFDTKPIQTNWSMAAHCIAPPEVTLQLETSLRSVVAKRLKNAVGWRAAAPSPLPTLGISSQSQAGHSPQVWTHEFVNVPEVDYVHLAIFAEAMMGITDIRYPDCISEAFLPCEMILPLEFLFRVSLNLSRYSPKMRALLQSVLQHELMPASTNGLHHYRSV